MALTYGSIVHAALDMAYSDIRAGKLRTIPTEEQVKTYLKKVEKLWETENPKADVKALEQKETSLMLAEITLPPYFEFWRKDLKEMQWQALEEEFKIPYASTHGNTFLKGKIDGVFTTKGEKLWLLETKTKSIIREDLMIDTLPIDHQNLFYLSATWEKGGKVPSGCLYNVIRRIGLEQKKTETLGQYKERCKEDIAKRPEFYFLRLEISVGKDEMLDYRKQLMEQVNEFLMWWKGELGTYRNTSQCETKYGACPYLGKCTGCHNNYVKRDVVFRELENA
jgi:hypothetical protein